MYSLLQCKFPSSFPSFTKSHEQHKHWWSVFEGGKKCFRYNSVENSILIERERLRYDKNSNNAVISLDTVVKSASQKLTDLFTFFPVIRFLTEKLDKRLINNKTRDGR
jgi:hypothetical protein